MFPQLEAAEILFVRHSTRDLAVDEELRSVLWRLSQARRHESRVARATCQRQGLLVSLTIDASLAPTLANTVCIWSVKTRH